MNPISWISKNAPEPVLSILRPIYRGFQSIRSALLAIGDSLGIIGPETIYDDSYYKQRQGEPWRSASNAHGAVIRDFFEPNSVIDFGCAIGAHLEPFYDDGVTVKGVEGHPAAIENSVIPPQHLDQHDLREYYQSNRGFELVLCFEVVEHIPERFADTLVETLTSAGDTVVMTAAPPGQSGTHHINLQPKKYWDGKFKNKGFMYDDATTKKLQDQLGKEAMPWILENLMVYRREE